MNFTPIRVPFLGVNDTDCELVKKCAQNSETIAKDSVIGVVETTKTTLDIESSSNGFIYWLFDTGHSFASDEVIGVISNEQLTPAEIITIKADLIAEMNKPETNAQYLTKKAELLAKKNTVNINKLMDHFSHIKKIMESHVTEYIQLVKPVNYTKGFCDLERIAIIGGAGGGGALIIIDALLNSLTQKATVILDRDKSLHGQSILGVPIAGSLKELDALISDNKIDSAIIAFNRDLNERARTFKELKNKNIVLTNIIDKTSNIRSRVKIGQGNVILGNTYIGACSVVGNNNFISSNVCLEHGNTLGDHCAFGPNVATSGNVVIGDRVRFASGIVVEPNINIRDGAIIASGAVVREPVDANTVLQVSYQQVSKKIN